MMYISTVHSPSTRIDRSTGATIAILLCSMLAIGCASTPVDPDRASRFIMPGTRTYQGYHGDIDTGVINSLVVDRARKQGMESPGIIWNVPVARLEGTGSVGSGFEFLGIFGWEMVVVIIELSRDATQGTEDRADSSGFIIAYVMRERVGELNTGTRELKTEWSPWFLFTDTKDMDSSFISISGTLHLEDVAFHVEWIADHLIGFKTRLVDRDDCIEFDETYLRNWDTLFGARPRFAYPICD